MRRAWLLLVAVLGALGVQAQEEVVSAGASGGGASLDESPPLAAPEELPQEPEELPQEPEVAPTCESRILPVSPRIPSSAAQDRKVAADLAAGLARLVARRNASPERAAALARSIFTPKPNVHAVALGVPQLNLGLLHFRHHLIIFQRNNSVALERYWRALAASWNRTDGSWSSPFIDCTQSGIVVHGFSISKSVEENRAAAAIFMPFHLNQCDSSLAEVFGGPHRCDDKTTTCVSEDGWGLNRGGYRCICRGGHYYPEAKTSWRGFAGELVERDPKGTHRCLPCSSHCEKCDSNGACTAIRDDLVRDALLVTQAACMLVTVMLAAVVFKQRKCKTIASGMWTILETILLGTFLLYSTVVVRFFEPSVEQCLVEPWFRELGFVVCYGAIILKLYRHLIEFRTRKAHRWVVKDVDLLKYLLAMVVAVLCYLAAFTASSLNFIREDYSLMQTSKTSSGQIFWACKPLWWDYVTEAGEMLILLFGIHLSYASRNAFTQFQERRFLCAAICVEAVVSGIFYVLRAIYVPTLHPDYVYLAYFLRSQLTSTVVIILIFTPKLWYQHKQVRSLAQEFSCRLPVDAFRAGEGGALTADGDVAELNLADMNPEDIRAELKRLYTQLEVLRNKTLRADNPHISKRRGGRKVAHRRFSLQALQHKQRAQRAEQEVTECEPSRTPEDSVCSAEGPSAFTDGPSVAYSEPCFGTPKQAK